MKVRSFIDADPEFTAISLVFIEVRGREHKKFLRWCLDNEIYSERGGGGGMGREASYYRPEVAEKVLAWLKENGATRTEEIPSWEPIVENKE